MSQSSVPGSSGLDTPGVSREWRLDRRRPRRARLVGRAPRLTVGLLIMAMLTTLTATLPTAPPAEASDKPDGDGSEENPYRIGDAARLIWLRSVSRRDDNEVT